MKLLMFCFSALLTLNVQANNLKHAAWLQGCWEGNALGGQVSECWIQDGSGKLTAVFQLQKNGKQIFSEIVSLGEYNGRIEMRVKHFDQAFSQWKSDNGRYFAFKLKSHTPHHLKFDGLSYQLISANLIEVKLKIKNNNGDSHIEEFYLARRKF